MRHFIKSSLLIMVLALSACSQAGPLSESTTRDPDSPLRVVATTNIIGDIVDNIGKEDIDLHILIPAGVDEHSFQVTPEDVAQVAEADIIFVNGAGLEQFLEPLLENVGNRNRVIAVSDGIELLQEPFSESQAEETGAGNSDQDTLEFDRMSFDPHVWTDPTNVKIWVDNIARSLADFDPASADRYQERAIEYKLSLEALDQWIQGKVESLPVENRLLVSDHIVLNYFARRYGFDLVGAIIPAYSTLAEPTAQDIARLEDTIRQLGVKTIFVGNTINPSLAERIAQDTQTRILSIYTGSLGEPGGPATTYLEYMRYNTEAIINGLQ